MGRSACDDGTVSIAFSGACRLGWTCGRGLHRSRFDAIDLCTGDVDAFDMPPDVAEWRFDVSSSIVVTTSGSPTERIVYDSHGHERQHARAATHGAFSPGGALIATPDVSNVASGRSLGLAPVRAFEIVTSLAWSPDSRWLYRTVSEREDPGQNGELIDVAQRIRSGVPTCYGDMEPVDWAATSAAFVIRSNDCFEKFGVVGWSTRLGEPIRLHEVAGKVFDALLDASGTQAAIIERSGAVLIADLTSRMYRPIAECLPRSRDAWAWSPAGDAIACATAEGDLTIIETASGAKRVVARRENATRLAWSDDGSVIATVVDNGVHVVRVDGRGSIALTMADGGSIRIQSSGGGVETISVPDGGTARSNLAPRAMEGILPRPVE